MLMQEQKMNAVRNELMRVKDAPNGPRIRQCEERFTQLVGDIFIGNEMVPDVIETPPRYPLELTYRLLVLMIQALIQFNKSSMSQSVIYVLIRTVRTFPGMRVTAETTRFKPMVEW